ncbi:hypothetical protein [Tolypothrix sp. VBCCA 56010]|uniref:hypothetical protein n=1 Tax=Tolypothrix sp. VBCCA 56010 TaxID=3137731 RepID=UPI003D7EF0FD
MVFIYQYSIDTAIATAITEKFFDTYINMCFHYFYKVSLIFISESRKQGRGRGGDKERGRWGRWGRWGETIVPLPPCPY